MKIISKLRWLLAVISLISLSSSEFAMGAADLEYVTIRKGEPGRSAMSAQTAACPDWAHGMRIIGHYKYEKLSEQEVKQHVAALKDAHVNVVFVGGGSFHPITLRKKPRYIRALRRFTDACHKEGIRVILHCMGLSRYASAASRVKRGPTEDDELRCMRDKHGRVVGSGNYWWYCANSPHSKEFLSQGGLYYDMMTQAGVDGYFDDWARFLSPTACACKHCRKKFTAETGYTLPENPESSIWLNFDDPTWRAFAAWRAMDVADFMAKLRDTMRKTTPGFIISSYCTSGIVSKYGWTGYSYANWAREGTQLGIEQEGRDAFYGAVYHLPADKHLFGLGSFYGGPPGWILNYYPDNMQNNLSERSRFFNWAKIKSQGLSMWMDGTTGIPPATKECFGFEAMHQDIYRRPRPFGNIGVLFSDQTKSLYRGGYDTKDSERYCYDWQGWCHVLSESNIPYNVLPDEQIEAGEFHGYDLLILVNAACLSKGQCAKIKAFVQEGGSLIATHETSLYDETGKRLDNFALAGLFGVDNRSVLKSGSGLLIDPKKGHAITQGLPDLLPHNARQVIVEASKEAEVLAETEVEAVRAPGMVVSRYGKGKVIYIAGKPGYFSRFPGVPSYLRMKRGKYLDNWVWMDARIPGYGRLILNTVDFCLDGKPSLRTMNLPKGVLVNGLRVAEGKIAVHLLNALGGELKSGMKLTAESLKQMQITYPEVKSTKQGEPMMVLLREKIRNAYLVSPDFGGEKKTTVKENADGYSAVTIPSLRRYSVVVLQK